MSTTISFHRPSRYGRDGKRVGYSVRVDHFTHEDGRETGYLAISNDETRVDMFLDSLGEIEDLGIKIATLASKVIRKRDKPKQVDGAVPVAVFDVPLG